MQVPVPRVAVPEDLPHLVALVAAMHREESLPQGPEVQVALDDLVRDPRLGFVAVAGLPPEGYAAVVFGHSLEFGGRDAFLDELFVAPPHRNRGWGTALVAACEREAEARGVRALHLEVDFSNGAGKRLYLRLGYKEHPRQLMTKVLAPAPAGSHR
ncbi:MAG: GNAT family N-acetyltransferase [Thermoplasmatota archaeon]